MTGPASELIVVKVKVFQSVLSAESTRTKMLVQDGVLANERTAPFQYLVLYHKKSYCPLYYFGCGARRLLRGGVRRRGTIVSVEPGVGQ